MKYSALLVLGIILVFGGVVYAAPFQLDDQQMGGVTAGSADVDNYHEAVGVDITQAEAGGSIL